MLDFKVKIFHTLAANTLISFNKTHFSSSGEVLRMNASFSQTTKILLPFANTCVSKTLFNVIYISFYMILSHCLREKVGTTQDWCLREIDS